MPFPDRFDPVHAEDLPPVITLSIPREELDEVVTWSQRFASSPIHPITVWCVLTVGARRWVCSEANVDAFIDVTAPDQRCTGVVSLPNHVLDSALLAAHHGDPVTIVADLVDEVLMVRAPGFSFRCPMPPVPERLPVLDVPVGTTLIVPGPHVESAAQVLRVPSGAIDNENDSPWPYVTVSAGDGVMRLARDWSEFDGGRVEVDIEIIGTTNILDRVAAFFSDVVLRELWLRTSGDVDSVRFCFFSECPDIMVVLCENWGMRVALGSEFVLRYRRVVEARLDEAGFEVDHDERRDWSPRVSARVDGTPIVVELVRGDRIRRSHARITGVVAEGLTWSTELGAELNSWNDAWRSSKLLFRDGSLVVVRDLPIGSLDGLADAVRDLVDKTRVVFDVVGPMI